MRFQSGSRRSSAAIIISIALCVLASCESTPPAAPSPVSADAPAVVPDPVREPSSPAPLPLAEEKKTAAPPEAPEKPSAVSSVAAPRGEEPSPIAEEPENPFAQSGPVFSTPSEKAVSFEDIPLPAAPVFAYPVPVPVAASPAAAPVPPVPVPAEKPSVSTPLKPPAGPVKTPVAKAAPAKSPPEKKAESAKPASEPKKDAPAPAKEQPAVVPASLPELPSRAKPAAEEEKTDFSRAVRVMAGQLLEIPYRGLGWIFLGERSARKGLPYDSRRLDKDGLSFMFRAEEPGVFVLKFYRQDFVNDYIVNDFVQVTVEPSPAETVIGGFSAPVDRGRVVAEPRWPPAAASVLPAASGEVPSAAPTSASPAAVSPIVAPAVVSAPAATSVATSVPASSAASAAVDAAAQGKAAAGTSTGVGAALHAVGPSPVAKAPSVASAGSIPASPSLPSAPLSAANAGSAAAARNDSGIERERSPVPAAAAVTTPVPPPVDPATIAENASMDEFLSIARKEAEYGRTANALAVLDKSRALYPAGSDETWWQYGRLLEANGPTKDVKSSLAYYRRLIAEYPQSPRYDEARKRIAYLERYYFEIR